MKQDKGILVYFRDAMENLPIATNQSSRYWRSQARQIFARKADINMIFVSCNGRKTDYLPRAQKHTVAGEYFIAASTGGKWGKSRREFGPLEK